MVDITDDSLIESKDVRNREITRLKSQHSEDIILNKVKSLFFAVWQGVGRVTRQQVADFYEVPVTTIDSNYQRNKDEFDLDEVKVFQGEALREVRRIVPLTSSTPKEAIYTPSGVLRMGFILRDSQVAKLVRTTTIRFIQGIGISMSSQMILKTLIETTPSLSHLIEGNSLKISSPYAPYWDKMKSTLRKKYSTGGIPKMTADDLRKAIQFCSSYTDKFKLQGIKELRREIAGKTMGQYPSLISDIIQFNGENDSGSLVIMFQFQDLIVELNYVQDCVGRGYIQTAKNDLGVDKAYLIFVAPFGATSYAEDYINRYLVDEYKGYVGVLTIKELADLLYDQAWVTRQLGTAKGEITNEFSLLRTYEFPEKPALYEQLSLLDDSEVL
jgi:hypothetical protein